MVLEKKGYLAQLHEPREIECQLQNAIFALRSLILSSCRPSRSPVELYGSIWHRQRQQKAKIKCSQMTLSNQTVIYAVFVHIDSHPNQFIHELNYKLGVSVLCPLSMRTEKKKIGNLNLTATHCTENVNKL